MKKIDFLTPLGMFIGISMLFLGILSNSDLTGVAGFFQVSSIVIVLGGVIGGLLINFSVNELKGVVTIIKQAFQANEQNLAKLIQTFVKLSEKARREGLLSLETELDEIEDPFIKKGILLAVDGIEPEVISDIMSAEILAMEERHRKGRNILEKAGEYAPAWGMLGTLVGLILMLKNLNDPSTLGPNMAVALLTTLYGSLLANLVFLPMASKLENKTADEIFFKQITIEGVIGVQSGQNPKILEEKLSAFVSVQAETKKVDEEVLLGEPINEA